MDFGSEIFNTRFGQELFLSSSSSSEEAHTEQRRCSSQKAHRAKAPPASKPQASKRRRKLQLQQDASNPIKFLAEVRKYVEKAGKVISNQMIQSEQRLETAMQLTQILDNAHRSIWDTMAKEKMAALTAKLKQVATTTNPLRTAPANDTKFEAMQVSLKEILITIATLKEADFVGTPTADPTTSSGRNMVIGTASNNQRAGSGYLPIGLAPTARPAAVHSGTPVIGIATDPVEAITQEGLTKTQKRKLRAKVHILRERAETSIQAEYL